MPKRGENTKKAEGNAKKAAVAAQKQDVVNGKKSAEEADEWLKGARSTKKAEETAQRKADAAKKKAEKDALLAEEEKDQPAKPKGVGAKTAQKKTNRGLDSALSSFDAPPSENNPASALNASGIDNALDALSLTSNNTQAVERHPERRFKAAYAAYEAKRLPELDEERKGLRRNQKIDLIRKEFEKSEENPFNQASVRFDATREEIQDVRSGERAKVEGRLAEK